MERAPERHRWRDLWNRLRGVPVRWDLGPWWEIAAAAGALDLRGARDAELRARAASIRERAASAPLAGQALAEACAVFAEAAARTLGLRPFPEQLLAGLALNASWVAELATGEGKTLAAVLPAWLHACAGQGVHVLTFNDYLARRDAAWMGPLYELLGVTVGCVQAGMAPDARRRAYAAEVTYATAKEVGFDLLRDGVVRAPSGAVLRPFHLAIVDEADSIMIDEARVPLVLAGRFSPDPRDLSRLTEAVRALRAGVDFATDQPRRNVFLTEAGFERLEAGLGCGALHGSGNAGLLADLHQALHAEFLLRRDVDYIVRAGRVEIVDEFTGRVVPDRQWPDGLQAAVEAKEGLRASGGGQVLGRISLQHFLNLYPRLAGMTATARLAAEDLAEFYALEVAVIPPHRPCVRVDGPDRVFSHQAAKVRAVVAEAVAAHARGRPILVGTASVEESEALAAELGREGLACQVLNAKNDELEAAIVARAGEPGAITISTAMAGRGTDIRLGGAREEARDEVVALGGLLVLGTQRHESRRVDDQLRGRAGRQGDPGESLFFVSLEDGLFVRHGLREALPRGLGRVRQDAPLSRPGVGREITRAQRILEGQNHEIRQTLWRYSSKVEQQRQHLQRLRREVLGESSEGRAGLAREVRLHQLDRLWAEHLEQLGVLRETVILEAVGGKSPLDEFLRVASRAYAERLEELDERVAAHVAELEAAAEPGLLLEQLRGPSSTWTYLVNDDQFERSVWLLSASQTGGLAVAAGLFGPLLTLWLLLRRWFGPRPPGDLDGGEA
jgi:preprotein translocase subunit SecA